MNQKLVELEQKKVEYENGVRIEMKYDVQTAELERIRAQQQEVEKEMNAIERERRIKSGQVGL